MGHFLCKGVGSLGLIQSHTGWLAIPTVYGAIYPQGPRDVLYMCAEGTAGSEVGALACWVGGPGRLRPAGATMAQERNRA